MNFAIAILASVAILQGDDSPDTIEYMKGKSEAVVVAEVVGFGYAMGSAPISDVLYPRPFYFDAKITGVLKGPLSPGAVIPVTARRIERANDPLFVKVGDKVILFLKSPEAGEPGRWRTVDAWFGVSPYSQGLEAALAGKLDFISP